MQSNARMGAPGRCRPYISPPALGKRTGNWLRERVEAYGFWRFDGYRIAIEDVCKTFKDILKTLGKISSRASVLSALLAHLV